MTTIAYRDGIMASDSGMYGYGTLDASMQKIFYLFDGRVFAGCGDAALVLQVRDWLNGGEKPDPKDRDAGGIIADPAGNVWLLDKNLVEMPVTGPFFADGSGNALAMGAMAAGADAVKAIEIAKIYDSHTAGAVQWLKV